LSNKFRESVKDGKKLIKLYKEGMISEHEANKEALIILNNLAKFAKERRK